MWSMLFTATSLVGSGVQAGALIMFLVGICPTLRSLTVEEWLPIHVSLDKSIDRYMPPLNITTAATTLILVFLPQDPATRVLRIAALLCNISLGVISEAVNVPINKLVARTVPALVGGPAQVSHGVDMVAARERWIRWHAFRTAVITAGFLLYTIAAMIELR